MTFCVEIETDIKSELDYEKIFSLVANKAIDYEECPYECEINLIITDDKSIKEMNNEHRGIDNSTDVLSFPMIEYVAPSDFSIVENDFSDCFNPESGELLLGDIVISIEHVYAQAEKYGHSLEREFAFLIAHSMLHLFGYDHMEADEEKVMFERQDSILNELGITR